MDRAGSEQSVPRDDHNFSATALVSLDALPSSNGGDTDEPQSEASLETLLATRDRVAAALDRCEAALDRHAAAEALRRVYRDQLTGALQRDPGRDRLQAEVARCRRRGERLVIAFVDVDHLKDINDRFGHAAGDELLQSVCTALHRSLRDYDLVVRYGGDEFVCSMSEAGRDEAQERMDEVQHGLHAMVPGASISFGLAELRDDDSLDSAIRRADAELYDKRAIRSNGSAEDVEERRRVLTLAVVVPQVTRALRQLAQDVRGEAPLDDV